MKIKLFYGMKLKEKASGNVFTVGKYWDSDIDANHYKVKLGEKSYYSMDLINLIQLGSFEEIVD